jgi:hypothetical protein
LMQIERKVEWLSVLLPFNTPIPCKLQERERVET